MNQYRYIEIFLKNTDEYVDKIPLSIDLEILQNQYKAELKNDPMLYYCYHIKPDEKEFFSRVTEYEFNFDRFDYYLDCNEGE